MKGRLLVVSGASLLLLAVTGCAELTQGGYHRPGSQTGLTKPSDDQVAAIPGKPPSDGGAMGMQPPFGGLSDVAFADELWSAMQSDKFVGPDAIITNPYAGNMPHGEQLEIITTHAVVAGRDGVLISKKNYLGENITKEDVANDPDAYLDSVTVMFQREAGYDPDNNDWFWVKYAPDGSVMTNPMGMAMAGRVAKGMDAGCIACHQNAPGDDYVFAHDRLSETVAQR